MNNLVGLLPSVDLVREPYGLSIANVSLNDTALIVLRSISSV